MKVKYEEIMRDYSLIGVEAKQAIELALVDAEWYQSPMLKSKMLELLVRKNGSAIRDTIDTSNIQSEIYIIIISSERNVTIMKRVVIN